MVAGTGESIPELFPDSLNNLEFTGESLQSADSMAELFMGLRPDHA